MNSKRAPRRDLLELLGRRMARLNAEQRAVAWSDLARRFEDLGTVDLPKFKHLVDAVEAARKAATVAGEQMGKK